MTGRFLLTYPTDKGNRDARKLVSSCIKFSVGMFAIFSRSLVLDQLRTDMISDYLINGSVAISKILPLFEVLIYYSRLSFFGKPFEIEKQNRLGIRSVRVLNNFDFKI